MAGHRQVDALAFVDVPVGNRVGRRGAVGGRTDRDRRAADGVAAVFVAGRRADAVAARRGVNVAAGTVDRAVAPVDAPGRDGVFTRVAGAARETVSLANLGAGRAAEAQRRGDVVHRDVEEDVDEAVRMTVADPHAHRVAGVAVGGEPTVGPRGSVDAARSADYAVRQAVAVCVVAGHRQVDALAFVDVLRGNRVGRRGVIHRIDGDGHRGNVAQADAVVDPVGEAIRAVPVGRRLVAEAAVGVEGENAVGDVGNQFGAIGRAVRVAVVARHVAGDDLVFVARGAVAAGDRGPVDAEVAGFQGAAEHRHIEEAGGGVTPAARVDEADAMHAGAYAGEAVAAVGRAFGAEFTGIERAIVVAVEEHGPALQAAVARVVDTIGIEIVVHRAADFAQFKIAEVLAADAVASRQGDRVSGRAGAQAGVRVVFVAAATAAAWVAAQAEDGLRQREHVDAVETEARVGDVVVLIVAVVNDAAGAGQQAGEFRRAEVATEIGLRHILRQRSDAGEVGGSLTGAVHGDAAASGVGAEKARAGGEDVELRVVALREGSNLIGAGAVVDGAAGVAIGAAEVATPKGAGRQHGRIGSRVGDAELAAVLVIAVAGGGGDDHAVAGERRQFVADAIQGSGARPVLPITQRQVDDADAVAGAVGQRPLQGFFEVAEVAAARIAEHLEGDQIGVGRHAAGHRIGRGDHAGNIGAVAVDVRGIGVAIGEVPLIDDTVGHTVAVGVGAEEAVVEVDAGVDHHRADAAAIQIGETGVVAVVVEVGQAHRQGIALNLVRAEAAEHEFCRQFEQGFGAGEGQAGAAGADGGIGLHPAGLHDFGHAVAAGQQVVETVAAVGSGGGGTLAAFQHAVGVAVQVDGPAGKDAIHAGVELAVAVHVLELAAADAGGLYIAEIVAARIQAGSRGDRIVAGAGRGLQPARLQDFTDPVAAGAEIGKTVGTVAGGGRAGVDAAVAVAIQVDGPACQAGFARVAHAVGVEVAELAAGDLCEFEVAEIGGRGFAADDVDFTAAGGRIDGHPARLHHFGDAVGSGGQVGEAVGAVFVGHDAQFAVIQRAAAVAVEIEGPTGQAGLVGVLVAVAVPVLVLHAGQRTDLARHGGERIGVGRCGLDVAGVVARRAVEGVGVAARAGVDGLGQRGATQPKPPGGAVGGYEDIVVADGGTARIVATVPVHCDGGVAVGVRVRLGGQGRHGAAGRKRIQGMEDARRVDRFLRIEHDAGLCVHHIAGHGGAPGFDGVADVALAPVGAFHQHDAVVVRVVHGVVHRQETDGGVGRLVAGGRVDRGEGPGGRGTGHVNVDRHVDVVALARREVEAAGIEGAIGVQFLPHVGPAEIVDPEGARVEVGIEGLRHHHLLRRRRGIRRVFETDGVRNGFIGLDEFLRTEADRPQDVVGIARPHCARRVDDGLLDAVLVVEFGFAAAAGPAGGRRLGDFLDLLGTALAAFLRNCEGREALAGQRHFRVAGDTGQIAGSGQVGRCEHHRHAPGRAAPVGITDHEVLAVGGRIGVLAPEQRGHAIDGADRGRRQRAAVGDDRRGPGAAIPGAGHQGLAAAIAGYPGDHQMAGRVMADAGLGVAAGGSGQPLRRAPAGTVIDAVVQVGRAAHCLQLVSVAAGRQAAGIGAAPHHDALAVGIAARHRVVVEAQAAGDFHRGAPGAAAEVGHIELAADCRAIGIHILGPDAEHLAAAVAAHDHGGIAQQVGADIGQHCIAVIGAGADHGGRVVGQRDGVVQRQQAGVARIGTGLAEAECLEAPDLSHDLRAVDELQQRIAGLLDDVELAADGAGQGEFGIGDPLFFQRGIEADAEGDGQRIHRVGAVIDRDRRNLGPAQILRFEGERPDEGAVLDLQRRQVIDPVLCLLQRHPDGFQRQIGAGDGVDGVRPFEADPAAGIQLRLVEFPVAVRILGVIHRPVAVEAAVQFAGDLADIGYGYRQAAGAAQSEGGFAAALRQSTGDLDAGLGLEAEQIAAIEFLAPGQRNAGVLGVQDGLAAVEQGLQLGGG